uniref:Uncharacterized protein n=1 Tax=Trichuris muris TaxID=70415 RepID=A0A5S6PYH1_TRIMR
MATGRRVRAAVVATFFEVKVTQKKGAKRLQSGSLPASRSPTLDGRSEVSSALPRERRVASVEQRSATGVPTGFGPIAAPSFRGSAAGRFAGSTGASNGSIRECAAVRERGGNGTRRPSEPGSLMGSFANWHAFWPDLSPGL